MANIEYVMQTFVSKGMYSQYDQFSVRIKISAPTINIHDAS